MMESNLTTYPTAYASPFSGSCFLQQVATPPLTHAFWGKIGLKQKCDLKLNTVKTILLCTLLALGVMQARGAAMTEEDTNHSSAMAAFKEYVVDYVTLQNLPMPLKHGSKVDLRPVTKKIFIYTDTLSHTLPCKLHLSVNKKGYIKDCRVEGEVFPPLAERIKNVVLNYPDRIMEKGALKDKRMLNVSIDLLLPFAGNYVFLDTGLEDLNGFLMDFANCLMMSHPQNRPDSPIMEWNPFLHAPLSGRFCMGWVIEKDGSIGVYKKMADSLFPEYVYETYMRWLNHYGGYSEYLINVPVINNVAVPVWVVADYDFDAMTVGFKCYMIKEGAHNQ